MKTKYLLVSATGILTTIVSFWVVSQALVALRVPGASEIAIVLLALGVLLTLGGSQVAWRGYKHFKHKQPNLSAAANTGFETAISSMTLRRSARLDRT
jgi:hypothetical protein